MSGGQSKLQGLRAAPWALAPIAVVFLALMYAGVLIQPPPLRAHNPSDQFDAGAAHARLERIIGAGAPHPIDSAAQDEVRQRLLHEIEALGLRPEVHERFACRPQPRGPLIDCGYVRNIVFSVGPGQGPAVLVASHYDSVPAGPGVSDDGVGVAASLEIARLLAAETLQRRVIFLISDGEEQALLGAYDFAQRDPLMADVEALVNLEARGTRGPAMFFETNQPNGDAFIAFSGAPRPVANSVMADIYALMPNSTDVSVLTRPGLDVINLALLDGFENYHTPQDSLASFSTASLQHMGDTGLHAARNFARAPDLDTSTRFVYGDIASRAMISAPSWAGQPALALCVLIAFAAFWRGAAERRWRTLLLPLVALAFAAALAFVAGLGLSLLRPGEQYWFAHPEFTRAWCALSALLGLVLAFAVLRPADAARVGAAGFFWFSLLGLAGSLFLGGVSILFAAPALIFALGALAALVWRPALHAGAAAAALLVLVLFAPLFSLVELALGYDLPVAFGVLAAVLAWAWTGVIAAAQGQAPWRAVALVLTVGLFAALVGAAQAPAASAARPAPLNLTYFVDTTAAHARVVAGPARRALPSALHSAYAFSAETILPGDRYPSWATPAPTQSAPAPALLDVTVGQAAGERTVRGRLVTNGAYRVILRLPRSAAPLRASINGAGAAFADVGGADSDFVNLTCQGRACDGASVEIVLPADSASGEWYLIGQTPGFLPEAAAAVRAARPATNTPIQSGDGTVTLTRLAPLG